MLEPMRIFFFSDWRIQSLDLIESLLEDVGEVDLIVYGGDDIRRFTSITDYSYIPQEILNEIKKMCRYTSQYSCQLKNFKKVITAATKLLGQEPCKDYIEDSFWTLDRLLRLFRPKEKENWLSRIADKSRYGVMAIAGNDCYPEDRNILEVSGVKDIHTSPSVVRGWGFVGIEGSIYRESNGEIINGLGFIKHPDSFVLPHLLGSKEKLNVDYKHIIIVSHTPPYDCLDIGIRFGLGNLGSPSLAEFIRSYKPALVLTGHCHCRGGKSIFNDDTLIVNGASDDCNMKKANVSLIELQPGKHPNLTWLDTSPHSIMSIPEIGPKRAATLKSLGITQPGHLFNADDKVYKSINFGPIRKKRLELYKQAKEQNRHIWIGSPAEIPENLLFYDVETGLGIDSPHEPWLIGATIYNSFDVKHWIAPELRRKSRKRMYEEFFDFIKSHQDVVLCSWSGNNFDFYAVLAGLSRWCPRLKNEWIGLQHIDLLKLLKPTLVFPAPNWSLKTIAPHCGYSPCYDNDLDGFDVGLAYELFVNHGKPLDLEGIKQYNTDDVLMLAHIANWLRAQRVNNR